MEFPEIRRRSDRWIHEQVADAIEAAIRAGNLAPREMLPAEKRLADEAGVSRDAVRNALDLLRERGLVYTIPSLGSFVADPLPPE